MADFPRIALPLERRIWLIRGHRVMLGWDLAEVYGVETKRLNEQVTRNAARFPSDFMFQLTKREVVSLMASRSQNATLKRGQNVKFFPRVFTEHGAVMLASVLNSSRAVEASIQVVRAFVRLRALAARHEGLERQLDGVRKRLDQHDAAIQRVWDSIEALGDSTVPVVPRIGFQP